jgi:hypothetical protein
LTVTQSEYRATNKALRRVVEYCVTLDDNE